jgi:hypothetical protein
MKKKKFMFLMLTLRLVGTAGVTAQVNIGSLDDPKQGAILDLSQSGQKLGLILPSVSLNGATPYQLDGGSDGSNAAGTVVYNDGKGALTTVGIYVWDGSKWFPVTIVASLAPGAAKDYYETAKGDEAKDWTNASNTDSYNSSGYKGVPPGVDAGDLMVSEFVYSSNAFVTSKSPGSGTNAYADLSSLSSGITWADAVKKCANLIEGGYSDWYLPNGMEMITLGDAGYLGYSTIGARTDVYYWSSTEGVPDIGWHRSFDSSGVVGTHFYDKVNATSTTGTSVARCVRRN